MTMSKQRLDRALSTDSAACCTPFFEGVIWIDSLGFARRLLYFPVGVALRFRAATGWYSRYSFSILCVSSIRYPFSILLPSNLIASTSISSAC